MGISEIEILGSDDEDDGDGRASESGSGEANGSGAGPGGGGGPGASGSGSGSGRGSVFAAWRLWRQSFLRRQSVGWDQPLPWRRWLRPTNAPVIASLLAVVLVVAAAAFAAVQKNRAGNDFAVSLVSAQYLVRQDATGINLTLALENTGSTMIELTGASVYQPGLVRLTQTGDATGVTETEAGATTTSALGPGTAIASMALTPKDVELVTVPFRYDCGVSTLPPVSRVVSLAGFTARGTARTARLALPSGVTPWTGGNVVRSALCDEPKPESNVDLAYVAETGTTQAPLGGPTQHTYLATLRASGPAPVTIISISPDNPGIATLITPRLPITLISGEKVQLGVTWYVTNCVIATSAHSADGVKVTASARQTVQTWDATLGGRFITDLASGISTACSDG